MRIFIIVVLSLFLSMAAAADQPTAPAIAFSDTEITITNATRRGDVILFSVARVPRNYYTSVLSAAERLSDEDGDGVVHHPLRAPAPPRSVWGVIDLTSGLLTLAPAPGYELERVDLPGQSLRETAPGQVRKLDFDRDDLYVIVVRPEAGAWSMAVRDGGHRDEDRTPNGRVALPFETMEAIGAPQLAAPANVRPGDVIVVIDMNDLHVFSLGGRR